MRLGLMHPQNNSHWTVNNKTLEGRAIIFVAKHLSRVRNSRDLLPPNLVTKALIEQGLLAAGQESDLIQALKCIRFQEKYLRPMVAKKMRQKRQGLTAAQEIIKEMGEASPVDIHAVLALDEKLQRLYRRVDAVKRRMRRAMDLLTYFESLGY